MTRLTPPEQMIRVINCQLGNHFSEWWDCVGTKMDSQDKVDYIQKQEKSGDDIRWGFRQRNMRRVRDFTVRACPCAEDYKSWLCGVHPNLYAYYATQDGLLSDYIVVDIDAMMSEEYGCVGYCPCGWKPNGDGTGFVYWSLEKIRPFIRYRMVELGQ